MLVTVSEALPVLLRVTAWAEVVLPTDTLPKVRLLGETPARAVVPVPERLMVCGLPVALSATLTIAERMPDAVGLKVMLIVQLDAALNLDPHVLVCTKSPRFTPETAILVMHNVALPEFVKVTA